jgi:transcriptional regulator with XRE-family HTH domain
MIRMNVAEVIRVRRATLGLTQAQLAEAAGVDKRQIRRYEANETHPTLPVAMAIARVLGISLDELAGETPVYRVDLSGDWWACWQTFKDGQEILNRHEMNFRQEHDLIRVTAITRGTQSVEEGGYLWQGEFRIWDNEILMGWYASTEGPIRSKGVMYFTLHQHGIYMLGRWVGLSYDGPIVTGWGAIARTEDEVRQLMAQLKEGKIGRER